MTDGMDYDLPHAESVLMMAQRAKAGGIQTASHRLTIFPRVVDEFGKAVEEVKRCRVHQISALAEAMDAVRLLVRREIEDALSKHSSIFSAAQGVRSSMALELRDDEYLWKPAVTDKEFSVAVDRLFTVLLESDS